MYNQILKYRTLLPLINQLQSTEYVIMLQNWHEIDHLSIDFIGHREVKGIIINQSELYQ